MDEQTGELHAFWVIKAEDPDSGEESGSEDLEDVDADMGSLDISEDGQNNGNWVPTEEHLFSIFHSEHTWTRFLKDTRDVMTFAVVEDSCLESNQELGRHCYALRIDEDGNQTRRVGGLPILQTSIKINERILRSHNIVKVKPVGKKPYWDLTNIEPGIEFLMGEQGVLKVLENPKSRRKRLKGKERAGLTSSPSDPSQSLFVEWYGVKSETLQEVKDVEIQQTFFGSNPKEHHNEAISIASKNLTEPRPIKVLILSDSGEIR